MEDAVLEALILQLVEWISERGQTYESVMSAWRTSCPRLPVWEEANDRGLIQTEELNRQLMVRITPAGLEFLKRKKFDAAGSDPLNRAWQCESMILRVFCNDQHRKPMAVPSGSSEATASVRQFHLDCDRPQR